MSYNSKIPWTNATWNFLGGCSSCSPGCTNCAAAFVAAGRLKNHPLYQGLTKNGKWTGKVRLCTDIDRKDILEQPLHWRNPRRIFPCFMGDLFHPKVPFEFIEKIWDVMCDCMNIHNNPVWLHRQSHTFQILTKRIDRALEFSEWMLKKHRRIDYPNVWFGVSISNQDEMWKAEVLSRIPAAVKYVSFEPLLKDITDIPVKVMEQIDWAIIGCESGPKRRPCEIRWIRELANDFIHFRKPVFVKQININGKVSHNPKEWPKDLRIQQYP